MTLFTLPARWLFRPLIRRIDGMTGTSNDYLRFVLDRSLVAFVKFLMFAPLAMHRSAMPAHALHLARILTTRHVDCGTCVQATVNQAVRDGVRAEWIQAVLDGRPEVLPPELRDVHDFVGHILAHSYEEDALREVLRGRYGDEALVDLAFAVATSQVFPYTKKVLGFASSCSLVRVQLPAA